MKSYEEFITEIASATKHTCKNCKYRQAGKNALGGYTSKCDTCNHSFCYEGEDNWEEK